MEFSNILQNLTPLIYLALAIFLTKLILLIIKTKEDKPRYEQRHFLLTPAEAVFFEFLTKNLDSSDYHIATKVRLADVFKCINKGKVFYKGFNQIRSKHFDFVIINKEDSKILLVIELDDKSHNNPKTIKRDKFKDDISFETGLKLIRIPVSNQYDEKILELFNI